jgi:hypothetical protein
MGRILTIFMNGLGDFTIVSPSTNSIIFKTNHGTWEAMRLNTNRISMNTSSYISGTTILSNNVGIGITNPNCRLYISTN